MALIEFKSRNYKKMTINTDKIIAIVETKDKETMVITVDPDFYIITDEPIEEAVKRWNEVLNGIQNENVYVRNKRYKCDFCDYQTNDKFDMIKHERERDVSALHCAIALKKYCDIKHKDNGCQKCYFYVSEQCFLDKPYTCWSWLTTTYEKGK